MYCLGSQSCNSTAFCGCFSWLSGFVPASPALSPMSISHHHDCRPFSTPLSRNATSCLGLAFKNEQGYWRPHIQLVLRVHPEKRCTVQCKEGDAIRGTSSGNTPLERCFSAESVEATSVCTPASKLTPPGPQTALFCWGKLRGQGNQHQTSEQQTNQHKIDEPLQVMLTHNTYLKQAFFSQGSKRYMNQ